MTEGEKRELREKLEKIMASGDSELIAALNTVLGLILPSLR